MTSNEILRVPEFKELNDIKIDTIITAALLGLEMKFFYIGDEVFLNMSTDALFGNIKPKNDTDRIAVTIDNLDEIKSRMLTDEDVKTNIAARKFLTNGTICLTSNDEKFSKSLYDFDEILSFYTDLYNEDMAAVGEIDCIQQALMLSIDISKLYLLSDKINIKDHYAECLISANELFNDTLYQNGNPNLQYVLNSVIESISFIGDNPETLISGEAPQIIDSIESEILNHLTTNLPYGSYNLFPNNLSENAHDAMQDIIEQQNASNGGALRFFYKDGKLVAEAEIEEPDDDDIDEDDDIDDEDLDDADDDKIYDKGYNDGFLDGINEGNKKGYNLGVKDGYKMGYSDGKSDAGNPEK